MVASIIVSLLLQFYDTNRYLCMFCVDEWLVPIAVDCLACVGRLEGGEQVAKTDLISS